MRLFPTSEGFKLIFRRPAIPAAEIAWRWIFAASAWFLMGMFWIEYSDSLAVNPFDRWLISSQQPVLILHAIRRIFRGSAVRFTEAALVLGLGLCVIWILLSALGRIVGVKAVLEQQQGISHAHSRSGHALPSLLGLNFLRVAVLLAAVICGIGAVLISGSVWAATHLSVPDATRMCFAVLMITWTAWQVVNWFLSMASLIAVARGESTFSAVAGSVRLLQERPAQLLVAGAAFGFTHVGAFLAAAFAAIFVFGAMGVLGLAPVFLLEWFILCVYSIVVNFLYTGRMAAYLLIMNRGDQLETYLEGDDRRPGPPAIDQSELILSDLPQPAF
jgi:hypothetical protein